MGRCLSLMAARTFTAGTHFLLAEKRSVSVLKFFVGIDRIAEIDASLLEFVFVVVVTY